ncbi:MAG: hypothetical protein Q4A75_04345 [Peptostreptococcaceae bacterium]|nr:hypothetical protein [Peptostreptococcaceae bacterium]
MKITAKALITNVQQRKIKDTGEIKHIVRFVGFDDGKSMDVWSSDPLPFKLDGFTPVEMEMSLTQGTKGLNLSLNSVQKLDEGKK